MSATHRTQEIKKENIIQTYVLRTNATDFINILTEIYDTESYDDFQTKIPSDIKIQLLKQLGTQMKS